MHGVKAHAAKEKTPCGWPKKGRPNRKGKAKNQGGKTHMDEAKEAHTFQGRVGREGAHPDLVGNVRDKKEGGFLEMSQKPIGFVEDLPKTERNRT